MEERDEEDELDRSELQGNSRKSRWRNDASCGSRLAGPAEKGEKKEGDRIIGGKEMGRGKAKWLVALYTSSGQHFCGGSCINDRVGGWISHIFRSRGRCRGCILQIFRQNFKYDRSCSKTEKLFHRGKHLAVNFFIGRRSFSSISHCSSVVRDIGRPPVLEPVFFYDMSPIGHAFKIRPIVPLFN